ncbi:MAG TPA: UvrD-helicase domain-containing protein, partial [Rubrivivax sp.]
LGLVRRWLVTAWLRRTEVERADAAHTLEGSVPSAAGVFPDCAGLAQPQALLLRPPLVGQIAALARELGAQANKTPQDAAQALRSALAQPDPAVAYAAVRAALFTKDGAPRKKMGDLAAHAAACDALDALQLRIDQQSAHEEHLQMVALVRVLLDEYVQLKRQRGLADMADLETAALKLLCDTTLSGWVQQRLDTRLKHLLIDEFQDTSPLQWQALFGWLSSYAGAGGGASGQRPLSVFIVGDPKQSIYRFRRAEPRVFEAAREFVVHGLAGAVLECDHTRRCAPEVVTALNAVFEPASASGEWPGFRPHTTAAAGGVGLRRLPDVLRPEKAARMPAEAAEAPVWRDTLTEPRHEPEEQLRAREAQHVAQAVAELLGAGRWRPKDIMVLSRKRVALRAVSEALLAVQVPHVMPEAVRVGETPEAQDLLAVLDVLVSPGHDLALARALRSPVFGASDAELLRLSQAARGASRSWWSALTRPVQPWDGALARAAALLGTWAAALPWLPPHDLLDRIVHDSDFVARLAAAAPPARRLAALQVVDALLAAALALDGGRYATPYGFVRALRSRPVEAVLVPAADAVRLLTIHGAKGLEAPVVFIVDTDPEPPQADIGTLLTDWPVGRDAPARVAFVASGTQPLASMQALQSTEAQAAAREELNALYVAMSRAETLLVVSRTEPSRGGSARSWWSRLMPLAPLLEHPSTPLAPDAAPVPIVVPELPTLLRPAAAVAPAPRAQDPTAAALGSAVHRVLEWAARPGAPLARDQYAGAAAAAARAFGLDPARAGEVVPIATQVLASPQCALFFDPAMLAWAGNEVPVVVAGQGGRIDRLVAFDEPAGRVWWVLDYKLHAAPAQVAEHRAQLAGYVGAVRLLQPGERVRGAFITAGGRLVPIDA